MAYAFSGAESITCPDRAGFDGDTGSVACLFKTSDTDADVHLLMNRDLGSGSLGVERQWQLRISNKKVQTLLVISGIPSVTSSAEYADGAWHSAVATWSWSGALTTLTLYVDGASQGTSTSAQQLSASTTLITLGRYHTGEDAFTGDMAECAAWSGIALTQADVTALHNRFAPSMVRPSSLAMHVPLIRPLVDLRGEAPTNNSATVSEHPRIIYPRRARTHEYTAAAGGAIPSLAYGRLVNRSVLVGGLVR